VAPQTPLLLVDNLFDAVGCYPGATLDASSEVIGREAFRAVDYERDRSQWEPASDGGGSDLWIRVHLTVTRAVDYAFLDRGHNLAGKTIYLEGSDDGASWPTSVALTVPSAIGGTPASPAMTGTEEGAAWTIVPATTARAWWRFRFPYASGFVPHVTGFPKSRVHRDGRITGREYGPRLI
jgi:hypothetical protein